MNVPFVFAYLFAATVAQEASLVATADGFLAAGNFQEALINYDTALQQDHGNYLIHFKRGLAYQSLGRHNAALSDFDNALESKPDFSQALSRRATLLAKVGNFQKAIEDYEQLANTEEVAIISDLAKAVAAAEEAKASADTETCIQESSRAIAVATSCAKLRNLRAQCYITRGDVHEAVGDLTQDSKRFKLTDRHAVILDPASIAPHALLSNLVYFSLHDSKRALAHIKKCLHFDTDAKECKRLFRTVKKMDKQYTQARNFLDSKQWIRTTKVLDKSSEGEGLLAALNVELQELAKAGISMPSEFLADLEEMLCEAYSESKKDALARPHCEAALTKRPESIPAVLAKANALIAESEFEEAIKVLSSANERTGGRNPKINEAIQRAQKLAKQAKQKDYYKVLDVARDADVKTIKKAYRAMSRKYHPDKYDKGGGLSAEEVERKMSAINEAYEILSDPELKARYDAGDDPNSLEGQHPGGNPFAHFGGSPFMFHQGGGQQFFQQGNGFNFKFEF
ncbi:DnaJ subfamily C member 3 [Neolecta irregularis DAH-3]|uniref:DnaJ subfamily C member 3 n=1 Tax=Neolecta irregularis (strain DAH-3) TaxID=1198029 RepID=A0A1U7LH67_NEOID|nr:DnaJ subfamily C member 3 [Neolecta irregularis DAH-3]|eukprot:OLL21871.1 DnaJ subfamily C member 3 [Neolecta irregularis DAH-3]